MISSIQGAAVRVTKKMQPQKPKKMAMHHHPPSSFHTQSAPPPPPGSPSSHLHCSYACGSMSLIQLLGPRCGAPSAQSPSTPPMFGTILILRQPQLPPGLHCPIGLLVWHSFQLGSLCLCMSLCYVWIWCFRSLLCRPLPLDIGRCTCVIVKEALPQGLDGGALYSLYTNVRPLKQTKNFHEISWFVVKIEY